MQFWCSAQGIAWSWTWRPYVGVWLLVALLAWGYWRLVKHARTGVRGPLSPTDRWRVAAASTAILLLWIALGWPVGTLGGGYLASVHMVQFLLIAMVAPPLLQTALPAATLQRIERRPVIMRVLTLVTNPIIGLIAFNAMLATTHMPVVVDTLMRSQLGSFVIDLAWFGVGFVFWWPIICPVPARPRFNALGKIGYLVFGTLAHVYVAMYLLLVPFPVYSIYELAPRVANFSASADQQIAGGIMLIGGGLFMFAAMTVLFFRWGREVEAADARQGEGSVAHAALR
ncbi:MAG TPA: cytochrome c oxidase assembly protein [Gemmatimonadaceae bacterium]|nr:cytochrome c oxidase assembly protein [Gemmatimonadaceae bacterium]